MKKAFTVERTSEALRKTASLLARESVTVTTQGARAFIEWDRKGVIQRINLPMVPRDADPEFLEALQGFLDHEVGHALNTEPVKGRSLEDKLSKKMGVNPAILRGMSNIVEDTRIETCMEREFPGSKRNLNAVRKFFVNVMQTKSLGEIPDGPEYDDMRRSYILPIYFRARAGQLVCENYMDDNDLWQYVKSYDDFFPDLSAQLAALKTTEDSVRLAAEVIEKTLEDTPPQDDEAGESGEGDEGEGKEEGESEESTNDGSSSNSESKEGDEDEGEGEDEGDSSGGDEDEGDSSGGDEGEDEDEGDSGDPSGSGGDDEGCEGDVDEDEGEDGKKGKAKTRILEGFDPSKFVDFDDGMASALESIIGGIDTGEPYHIFSRDLDNIEKPKAPAGAPVGRYEAAVNQTAAVLKKEIRRLIAARSLSVMVPGQRRGKLHAGSLHRLMTGDDRVFSKKQENVSRDTAITLLVDCSGSMRGSKMQTAMEAAWAFADVLNSLKVTNEVIGFTTNSFGLGWGSGCKSYDKEEVKKYAKTMGTRGDMVRFEPLHMPVFKGFDERFTIEAKRRMADYPDNGILHNNTDGECLRIAASRLHQQKASRRIMIVFSDGEPHSQVNAHALHRDLKLAVKEVTESGIETIGIGIESNAVSNFYSNSFVIHNSAQLTGSVMRELKAILLK